MKIWPLLAVAGVMFIGHIARADVSLDAKYEMPVATLKVIAETLGRAGEGPSVSRLQESINLGCPMQLPDTNGNGCEMLFSSKARGQLGEIGLRIAKPVRRDMVVAVYDKALAQISATDPNSTGGDLYFGNPFYPVADGVKDGTHYYCASEGQPGKKTWKCYLTVVEALSPSPAR